MGDTNVISPKDLSMYVHTYIGSETSRDRRTGILVRFLVYTIP